MIDIQKEIDKKIVSESFSAKKHYIFNSDKTTFKQLKQMFTDVFGSPMIAFSKKVPKIDVYLTSRDGKWFVSSYLRPQEQLPIGNAAKLRECDESNCNAVQNTLQSIVTALQGVDQVLLNRFFANGNNRLYAHIICPYCDDGKCFIQLDGIDCFDGKKNIGRDEKSSFELCKVLESSKALRDQFSGIAPEQKQAIRACINDQIVLEQLIARLAKLVDGIGWSSTINDYVQDRYSRYLVNKALAHEVDLSKNGALARELAARLSGTSPIRPTKSDLATFAKREGIDIKSDNYKEFINDIEQHADEVCKDVIAPIENALFYAMSCAANSALAYASLDSSSKAKKLMQQIAPGLFNACRAIEDCSFDQSKLDAVKKAFAKLCAYKDIAPKQICIMSNDVPYVVTCDCNRLQKLQEMTID